jgi:hypothetical protein
MIGTMIRKSRFRVLAAAALVVAGAAALIVAKQTYAASQTRMQDLADHAALAGVNALAATEGQIDSIRIEAANAAVYKVVASRSEIVPITFPSLDDMKVSVALTSSNTGKGVAFTSTARYVQPGAAVAPASTADAANRKRTRG